jgi:hypothetical protein
MSLPNERALAKSVNWNTELLDQLTWHWDNHLRPRMAGLTDEEYFWEPVENCWSIRPRAEARTSMAAGSGDFVMDYEMPEPHPAPVTTIAWRIGHILVGIFGMRNASHFGGAPTDYVSYDYPGRADDALKQLDALQAQWVAGIKSLSTSDLAEPCGETGYEAAPMAALILHINREVIHHGAEISLLRDLYAWRKSSAG